jgi:carbon monoxide dehydrogenase subunit G
MPEVSSTAAMSATPDHVWSILSDFSRFGEWNQIHVDFPDGAPELAAGTKFREKVTIMGMPGEATWTIQQVEPGSRLVMDGDGPMGIKLAMSLDVAGENGGTKVTMTSSFEGAPLAGPLGDAVGKAASQAADASLQKASALVG